MDRSDYENRARGQIEERARDEFLTNSGPVAEFLLWKVKRCDTDEIATLVTLAVNVRRGPFPVRHWPIPDAAWEAFGESSRRMLNDYITWRCADLDDELQELAHEIEREDAENLRDCMRDAETI